MNWNDDSNNDIKKIVFEGLENLIESTLEECDYIFDPNCNSAFNDYTIDGLTYKDTKGNLNKVYFTLLIEFPANKMIKVTLRKDEDVLCSYDGEYLAERGRVFSDFKAQMITEIKKLI